MAKISTVALVGLLSLYGVHQALAQPLPSMPYKVTGGDVPRHLQVKEFFNFVLTFYKAEGSLDDTMSELGVEGDDARNAILSALERSEQTRVQLADGRMSSRQRAVQLADIFIDLEDALVNAGFSYTLLDDYISRVLAPGMVAVSDEPFDAANGRSEAL